MLDFFNLEAEQVILGAVILNNDYLRAVEDILTPESFYEPAHQEIFERIVKLKSDEMLADRVSLKQFFDTNERVKAIGGARYILTLLAEAGAVINIREYAFLIRDNYSKRKISMLLNEAAASLADKSPLEISDNLTNELAKLDSDSKEIVISEGSDLAQGLAELWNGDLSSRCISTGLESLDAMLNGGFYPQKLYVIGAAPGCGKTSFAQQAILNGLENSIGCLFFSMEMEKENVLTRFLGYISRINPFRILSNRIFLHEKEGFDKSCGKWSELSKNFSMTEKGSLSLMQIKSVLKKVRRKRNLGLVVVDYVQIMHTRDSKNLNETTLIKENVTGLKELAKEFNVAVLLLSQITKEALGGRPGLKSLKGSGGIAEGADCVINMWNDNEERQEQNRVKHLNIEVAKNRNGRMGTLSILFDGEFGIFSEQQSNNF